MLLLRRAAVGSRPGTRRADIGHDETASRQRERRSPHAQNFYSHLRTGIDHAEYRAPVLTGEQNDEERDYGSENENTDEPHGHL